MRFRFFRILLFLTTLCLTGESFSRLLSSPFEVTEKKESKEKEKETEEKKVKIIERPGLADRPFLIDEDDSSSPDGSGFSPLEMPWLEVLVSPPDRRAV